MKYAGENYLFYLELTPGPTEVFLQLSQAFRKHHIRLIPIDLDSFKSLQERTKLDVLALIPDLRSFHLYREFKASYFNYRLRSGQVRLFEVSSFGKTTEFFRQEKRGDYFHMALPCETMELVEMIVHELNKKEEVSVSWPGGRRSRLPAM